MQNHKVMKTEKLNKTRWMFIISSFLLIVFLNITDYIPDSLPGAVIIVSALIWLGTFIFSIIFLTKKKDTLQPKLRRFLIILLTGIVIIYLISEYILQLDEILNRPLYQLIQYFSEDMVIIAGTYCFVSFLHRVEKILFGFVFGIILGLGLNRFGIDEAGSIVVFFLALSSFGFIFLARTLIKGEDGKQYKRSVVPYYFVLAFCYAIIALKFSSFQPALTSTLDLIGVIVFLLSCIALFISMPFSNFIEWSKSQKLSFQKLILVPFAFFLLVFSLNFLLPETTYRKIFFKEYTKKQKVYFKMEEYEIEEEN